MTKLNVVIPAVNVMVEIGGSNVEFRKVDRKAQAGDIVKMKYSVTDVDSGAFYLVEADSDSDLFFRDNAGDERYRLDNGHSDSYEVYAPVIAEVTSESTDEITFEGATYRKVDRSAREGDVIILRSAPFEEYDITQGTPYEVTRVDSSDDPHIKDDEGNDYDTCGDVFDVYEKVSVEYREEQKPLFREVKRKAAVGERIKIVNPIHATDYGMGDEFVTVRVSETGGAIFMDNAGELNIAYLREYVVLKPVSAQVKAEPSAQLKRLTVGDYAEVIADAAGLTKIGAIIKITKDRADSTAPYDGEYADGTATPVYFRESELEAATEAEFLAQKKPAEPVRLKVGYYAKVVNPKAYREHRRGQIVEIFEDVHDRQPFKARSLIDGGENWYCEHEITLATAEEVSAAQAEAQRVAQRKIAIGPFADGGFAQIIDRTKSLAMSAADTDGYVKVSVEPDGKYALSLRKPNGDYSGFCNADALRQITEEEYNAGVAPKPKFSVGDSVRLQITNGEHPQYGWGYVSNGDVGTVEHAGEKSLTVSFPKQSDWLANPKELVKLTAEEIATIEKEAQEAEEKRREELKWAKIGRKVDELKDGDIVQFTTSTGADGYGTGAIAVISNVNGHSFNFGQGGKYGGVADWCTLVTPVEQRFDTAESAAQSA